MAVSVSVMRYHAQEPRCGEHGEASVGVVAFIVKRSTQESNLDYAFPHQHQHQHQHHFAFGAGIRWGVQQSYASPPNLQVFLIYTSLILLTIALPRAGRSFH